MIECCWSCVSVHVSVRVHQRKGEWDYVIRLAERTYVFAQLRRHAIEFFVTCTYTCSKNSCTCTLLKGLYATRTLYSMKFFCFAIYTCNRKVNSRFDLFSMIQATTAIAPCLLPYKAAFWERYLSQKLWYLYWSIHQAIATRICMARPRQVHHWSRARKEKTNDKIIEQKLE